MRVTSYPHVIHILISFNHIAGFVKFIYTMRRGSTRYPRISHYSELNAMTQTKKRGVKKAKTLPKGWEVYASDAPECRLNVREQTRGERFAAVSLAAVGLTFAALALAEPFGLLPFAAQDAGWIAALALVASGLFASGAND